MSYADFLAYQAKQRRTPVAEEGVEREATLHEQILAEVRRRGWEAYHGLMSHRTYRTPGEPDFIILGDQGRFWLVECKRAGGKLSIEQQGMIVKLEPLHHTVHVITSLSAFLALIDEKET